MLFEFITGLPVIQSAIGKPGNVFVQVTLDGQ
jgi:hypothetical protein